MRGVDESQDDTGLRENDGKEEAAIRPKSVMNTVTRPRKSLQINK
jgi:hypothetical protein